MLSWYSENWSPTRVLKVLCSIHIHLLQGQCHLYPETRYFFQVHPIPASPKTPRSHNHSLGSFFDKTLGEGCSVGLTRGTIIVRALYLMIYKFAQLASGIEIWIQGLFGKKQNGPLRTNSSSLQGISGLTHETCFLFYAISYHTWCPQGDRPPGLLPTILR